MALDPRSMPQGGDILRFFLILSAYRITHSMTYEVWLTFYNFNWTSKLMLEESFKSANLNVPC